MILGLILPVELKILYVDVTKWVGVTEENDRDT